MPHKNIGKKTVVFGQKRNGYKFQFTIDKSDSQRVLQHWWCLTSRDRYVVACIKVDGVWKHVYLHNFLIGKAPGGMEVDHGDRDSFNNSRSNLSIVSLSRNRINRKCTNKLGFPGLSKYKDKFRVRIKIQKSGKQKLLNIGIFTTIEDAIVARRDAELKYHGGVFH